MYSFVIITDGKENHKVFQQVESIRRLGIEGYEIIIVGSFFAMLEGVQTILMPTTAKQGRLGALRNAGCVASEGDILVVTDDDMLFCDDWADGMWKYPDPFDLMSCRILNPDGSRYWDWKAHENGKNWLLDYDETHPSQSLTGGVTIMKRAVWEKVKWDDGLGFNQAEDVDFTNRVKAAGFTISMNKYSTIIHNANYTQRGLGVFKLEAAHDPA